MGILKHFTLPLMAVVHGLLFSFLFRGKEELAAKANFPGYDPDAGQLTAMEKHLMGALLWMHGALMLNCIVACLRESSHYRGLTALIVGQLIYFPPPAVSVYFYFTFSDQQTACTYSFC